MVQYFHAAQRGLVQQHKGVNLAIIFDIKYLEWTYHMFK